MKRRFDSLYGNFFIQNTKLSNQRYYLFFLHFHFHHLADVKFKQLLSKNQPITAKNKISLQESQKRAIFIIQIDTFESIK